MPSIENFAAPYPRARRHSRFDLKFPVSLNFESQGVVREMQAVSENVSIKGLLLKVRDRVPPRTSVNLTMEVSGPWFQHPVRLVAKGVVVRSEALRTADGFALAIKCQRPLVEMKIREEFAEAKISGMRNLPEAS
jgi:hypothetical protein